MPITYGFGEQEVVIFGFDAQILEYRVGPEPFHMVLLSQFDSLSFENTYPVLDLAMSYGVVKSISYIPLDLLLHNRKTYRVPPTPR
jgi:hypothetical protein